MTESPYISTVAQVLCETAEPEIGQKETEGSNLGPDVRKYQEATWLEPGAWPWCAAFVDWCVLKLLEDDRIHTPPFTGDRPRTAGAFDLENWGRNINNETGKSQVRGGSGILVSGGYGSQPSERVRAGDIVTYHFSHTGIAVTDEDEDGNFQAIEGNTDDEGGRDGDGVWLRRRNRRADRLRALIRIG